MSDRLGAVVSVSRDGAHRFSKAVSDEVELVAGLGVRGDAHAGATVQHLSRIARDPTQPNLRQVHLLHAELFDELARAGFCVEPGQLGENITTRGLDLLALPRGTVLHIGSAAAVEITGLRNPCRQIEQFRSGLLASVLDRDAAGRTIRKAGVMGIVRTGGTIRPGDQIRLTLPAVPHEVLAPV